MSSGKNFELVGSAHPTEGAGMVVNYSGQLGEKFVSLGQRVEEQYRRCNYNEADLPAIAAEALSQFDGQFSFDAPTIANFFATTSVPQQPKLRFSDLPVTVFQTREFYIEILIWTHSTTAIHQHGFSGAFKVLQGSSLHTTFSFQPTQVISPDLAIGKVAAEKTEYLRQYSVKQIHPGSEGLIHSLYHLDQPSITLVVRSPGHVHFQPQHSFYRPCLRYNKFRLEKDELVVMYSRLLAMTKQLTPEKLPKVWNQSIAQLDFPRLAYLYLHGLSFFDRQEDKEAFLRQAEQRYGEWVSSLREVAEFNERLRIISQSRQVLSDPDLRYFLALLMNAKDRDALLEMVKARYPERDPMECCAEWLTRLSKGKADTALRLAQVVQQANVGALRLGQKLGVTLPDGIDDETAKALFLSVVRQGYGIPNALGSEINLDQPTLNTFVDRLAQVEELECLLGAL